VRRLFRPRTAGTLVATSLLALAAVVGFTPASDAASKVSPGTFSSVSSGVALIHTYRCNGRPLAQGTGFLVGTSVVMTARHVVVDACRVRVRVSGASFHGTRWVEWSGGGTSASAADLATIKLDRPANGYVFRVRSSRVGVGMNLGMIGYPLGNRLSLNQGRIILRRKEAGAPVMYVRMLGAEGASGAPFIDDAGRVVGVLQVGLGSKDVLGQRTSGVVAGLDLVRWWGPRARLDLCRAYPSGGIAGCPGSKPPASPPPAAETVRVTEAFVSASDDGTPQASFVSAPTVKVVLQVGFAAPTKKRHTANDYAVGPSGERVEGCGGGIGVGWEGFTCDYTLNYPAPGAWRIVYVIDGRERAVGFQVTSAAPPPTATPHIQQCWSQFTGGSTSNWTSSSATAAYSASDILARGATNFAAIALMNPVPTSDLVGRVTLALIQPNGQTFATGTVANWQAGYSMYGYTFQAPAWSDGSLFFQHPEVTGQGTWTFQWKGPDGQLCNNAITIT
jgi:trypsin-like peptidase